MTDPKVGDVVYPSYIPAQVGRVVEVLNGQMVRVRWLRPTSVRYGFKRSKTRPEAESVISALGLRQYRELAEEHERKALRHREILQRVLDEVRVAPDDPPSMAKALWGRT